MHLAPNRETGSRNVDAGLHKIFELILQLGDDAEVHEPIGLQRLVERARRPGGDVRADVGNLQQVGAPLDVYRNPENLFVAGFLGTPPINRLKARVEQEGAVLSGDGFVLPIPSALRASTAGRDGLRVDTRGNIWETGPGGVWIISPEGKHLGTIRTPELAEAWSWLARDASNRKDLESAEKLAAETRTK